MYFITNRQSLNTNHSTHFEFDLKNNAPSNQVYFCERHGERNYQEIGHPSLMEALKHSDHQQILFYIHGFNQLPEDSIFQDAQALQQGLGHPMLVIPIIWPCDHDLGISKDYYDDQHAADDSGTAFARALQKFLAWQDAVDPCRKRMNILAHSMGNRVLRQTLKIWKERHLPTGVPLLFRNIYMVAADVVNETLQYDQDGVTICHAAKKVHVLYAADDLAMRGSKVANLRHFIASRRLGHTGCENIDQCPKNITQMDCDELNNNSMAGHSYFLHEEIIDYLLRSCR